MRKFYETKPVLFAVLWIAIYVVLVAPSGAATGTGACRCCWVSWPSRRLCFR